MKIAIIGNGEPDMVNRILKRIENETVETVEIVDLTKPEPLIIHAQPPIPIVELKTLDHYEKPDRKTHKRPYKFHR